MPTSTTSPKPKRTPKFALTKEQARVLQVMPEDGSPITAYAICVELNDVSTTGLEDINETLEGLQAKGRVSDEPNALFWRRTVAVAA